MPETALPALGHIEDFDLDPFRLDDRRHDELRNAISASDFEVFRPGVHQDHLNLATVVGIDGARRVGDEYAMPKRQSAARTNLRFETDGQRDAPACRNQPPLPWGDLNWFGDRRAQIEPCRSPSGCLRERQVVCVRFPGNFNPDPRW